MAYTYDQIFAVDPSNHERVADNGLVTIFSPGDPSKTPIPLSTISGGSLANPVQVNALGFGPPFMHPTLDRVAWSGGGLEGFFTSYEGIKNVALAAQAAAEDIQQKIANGEIGGGGGAPGGVSSVMYATGNSSVARPTSSSQVMVIFTTTGTTPPANMVPNLDLWIQRP